MDWWLLSYVALWILVVVEGIGLLVLVHAAGSVYLGTREAIERDGLPLGTPAPGFEGRTPEDSRVDLRDLLGTWTIAVFASPACQICRRMLPGLSSLANDLSGRARVAILLRGSVADAQALTASAGPGLQVIAIGAHGVAERYRVRVSPYLNVIDPLGVIRAKGLVNESGHVEHYLLEAGFRDDAAAARHGHLRTAEVKA